MQRIAVFCGANSGASKRYAQAAEALGCAVAQRGLELVYGGGSVGLMGIVAATALAHGSRVVGIIPRALMTHELAGDVIGELIIVETMAERKEQMLNLADAFVTLPGGLGTMDEFFEALTWGQLGIHAKPVGVLEVDDYFAGLLSWVDHAVAEGFVRPQHRDIFIVDRNADALLERMINHRPPAGLTRWQ
jgi:hypothetical protein